MNYEKFNWQHVPGNETALLLLLGKIVMHTEKKFIQFWAGPAHRSNAALQLQVNNLIVSRRD